MRKTGGTEKKRVRRQSTAVQNAAKDPNSDTPPRVCPLFPSNFFISLLISFPDLGFRRREEEMGVSVCFYDRFFGYPIGVSLPRMRLSLMGFDVLDMFLEFFFWVLIFCDFARNVRMIDGGEAYGICHL